MRVFYWRASLAISGKAEGDAKRWLLYPSLIIMYVIFLGLGLFWPSVLGGLAGEWSSPGGALYKLPYFHTYFHTYIHNTGVGIGAFLLVFVGGGLGLSVWWTILWILGRKYSNAVRVIFKPFAEKWTGATFGKLLLLVWFLTIVLGAVAVWLWV